MNEIFESNATPDQPPADEKYVDPTDADWDTLSEEEKTDTIADLMQPEAVSLRALGAKHQEDVRAGGMDQLHKAMEVNTQASRDSRGE